MAARSAELETTIARTQQLVRQARQRLAGQMPEGASRLVSLHDPDARPIRKGRIGHPVEFGSKAQVLDTPTGSCSTTRSRSATRRTRRSWSRRSSESSSAPAGCPGAVAADRGYGEASVDDELAALGDGRVAIPRRGKTSGARRQVEHTRPFRRLVKWRTGCEGGSHSSSAATAGTGPCWTASTARGSGAGTACWHTTWTGWPG